MSDEVAALLAGLSAESYSERLSAARALRAMNADISSDADRRIREVLAIETVPWVRGVLSDILQSTGSDPLHDGVAIPVPVWDDRLAGFEPELAREAITLATSRVLHEVAAIVGRAKLAAADDLGDDYQGSWTERELSFLADTCQALRRLNSATKVPAPEEFDLKDELTRLASTIEAEVLCPVHANGPGPFIVVADRALLLLALRNVIINAVEATLSAGPASGSRPVVVTWGTNARGVHVSVIDRGPGPPPFLAGIKTAGVSTKDAHPGYGLATASEALKSMNGTVEVRRNDRGGATVVLSWRDE